MLIFTSRNSSGLKVLANVGFTLVEFIMVIVISGIVATISSTFISLPMQSYVDLTRRTELVDTADITLRRITRDIRRALPNSVRIATAGTTEAIEVLNVIDGARYRDDPPGNVLDFSSNDPAFDVLGQLQNIANLQTGGNCFNGIGNCVIVYNTGTGSGDAYAGTNVANLFAVTDNIAPVSDQITIDNAALTLGNPAYPTASPGQRFFIIDTPVSFLCNKTTGTITRYWNYNIVAAQLTSDASLLAQGASSALLANKVSDCSFFYQVGVSQRAGLVTLQLTLRSNGESVTLLHQAHVANVP
jgi:MSHA biogenesis protein MshO